MANDTTLPATEATPPYPLCSHSSISPRSLPHSMPRQSVLPNHNSDHLVGTLLREMDIATDTDGSTTREEAVIDVKHTENTTIPPADFPAFEFKYDHNSMFDTPVVTNMASCMIMTAGTVVLLTLMNGQRKLKLMRTATTLFLMSILMITMKLGMLLPCQPLYQSVFHLLMNVTVS